MIKIGLISDTHSHLDDRILHHLKDVDEIWHAGDVGNDEILDILNKIKPTRIVYGNIDDQSVRMRTEEYLSFEIENLSVLILHIAGRPYKYSLRAKELILKYKPKLFICGHSHIALVQNDKNYDLLWINPGACGIKGFHKVRTMITFEINDSRVENLQLIELKTENIHL